MAGQVSGVDRRELRQRLLRVRSTVGQTIDALERPIGWNFVGPMVYPRLRVLVRLVRRVTKVTVLVLGAVLLGPFYLVASAATILFGRDTTFSTLSPFATTVLRAVRDAQKHGPVSVVVPTATLGVLSELLALPVMHDGPLPRLHLLFHDDPDVWANWYRPVSTEGVAGRLRASGWAPLIHLYATTEAAAERLRKTLGPEVYVRSVEDIFAPADLDAIRAAGANLPAEAALAPHEAALMSWLAERRADGLRVALVPGPLRLDKGARDLPTLVAALDSPAGSAIRAGRAAGAPAGLARALLPECVHTPKGACRGA